LKLPPSATRIALVAAISITINGERRKLQKDLDLASALQHFSIPERRVAVELNGTIVTRNDWQQTIICEGDKLEVVHLVGGG
jgi:thiamine biosynthesis protein ThiS